MSPLRRPKTAVRWRLTLLYGGLFLACGAGLLAVTYALVSHATLNPGGSFTFARKVPPQKAPPSEQVRAPTGDVPPAISRVLKTASGRATVRYVGAQQRISDLHQLEIESAIALAIMAVLSGALGWLVAGRVLRPLERAYDAQRRFVANASHELRTPLTASRALLEMVITDPRATPETFRQTCRDALEENEQQEQLIDALLALAEGEQGIAHREPVDLAVVVGDALRAHRADAAHARSRRGPDARCRVRRPTAADPPRLEPASERHRAQRPERIRARPAVRARRARRAHRRQQRAGRAGRRDRSAASPVPAPGARPDRPPGRVRPGALDRGGGRGRP